MKKRQKLLTDEQCDYIERLFPAHYAGGIIGADPKLGTGRALSALVGTAIRGRGGFANRSVLTFQTAIQPHMRGDSARPALHRRL
jgi:hypothetical protein